MKIAILSPFYPYRGGIAQFSAMLYTQLIADGHEVQAFNFSRLYPDILFPGQTQYVEEGDKAMAIPSHRLLDSINPISYFQTTKAIQSYQPDVLITAYWMSFFTPAYAHIANRLKHQCKVITLVHNAIPHEPRFFDKPLASLFFRQCDGFIVMSETVKQDVQALTTKDARCLLNPHPLYSHFGDKQPSAEAKKTLGLAADKKTLLFFGLIRDYKGLDLLIEVMNRLDDTYQLLIAGECYGSFDKYAQQIAASSAKERIHVHNRYISDSDIPLFFSAAEALVLPYRTATQSGVVSVAYHFDLPMIATPVGDFPDSIQKPNTGVVVSEPTSAALTIGIEKVLDKSNYALYKAAIEKEKAALSWQKLTKRLHSFVETL